MRMIRFRNIISLFSFLIFSVLSSYQAGATPTVAAASGSSLTKNDTKHSESRSELLGEDNSSFFHIIIQKKISFPFTGDVGLGGEDLNSHCGFIFNQSTGSVKAYLVHNYPFHAFW